MTQLLPIERCRRIGYIGIFLVAVVILGRPTYVERLLQYCAAVILAADVSEPQSRVYRRLRPSLGDPYISHYYYLKFDRELTK